MEAVIIQVVSYLGKTHTFFTANLNQCGCSLIILNGLGFIAPGGSACTAACMGKIG
jgi:hypothetical protein